MAQKFTVPITVKQLSSAGSDAVTVYVDADTYARLKIEAGGRLTWGPGNGVGDVNLYRDAADVLRTDDTFKTPTLFVDNIEIDTTGAQTDYILKYDGTKFTAASATFGGGGGGATDLDDLTDVVVTSPEKFQTLVYDGASWINEFPTTVSLVNNAEATTLQVGEAVYLFGNVGNHASVKRADNDSDTTSSKTVGLVAEAIPAGGTGPVVTRGYVYGMDLSVGYSAGQVLWLGESGGLTTTKPTAPEHLVFIGVVVRATNNGIIYVATQNGYELEELHDVQISGSLASGDFLKYNGTLWVNDAIDLGTDTTGNYMSGVTAGTGISVTHTPGEGSTATIANAGVTSINGNTGAITGVVTTGDTGTVTSTMIADGTIVNADINASAAIAHSKLANATAGQVLLGTTTTGVVTATTVSGDVTITGAGVTAISSGVVVNADVSASAAIDHSKLANITAGSVLLGNASNVPTATALSGDITVTSGGVTAIGSGVVVNADVNASAAIAHSKLANATAGQVLLGTTTTGVITATTVSGDVTITGAGVTAIGSGVIVNADINASAAIDKTKISGTAITAADTGTVTSTMIADGTIVNADINSAAAIALSKLSTAGASSGYVVSYNGTAWAASQLSNNSYNLDGGTAASTYGGITSLDGGTA